MASVINKMNMIQECIWKNIFTGNTNSMVLSSDLSRIRYTMLAAHVQEELTGTCAAV